MLARGRRGECKRLLRMLRDGRIRGVITDFTVHSIIVLLDRFKKLDVLRRFLQSLTAYKGLHVYTTSVGGEIMATDLAEETGLDMDDAIQYYAALTLNVRAIISFDKHFDNLKIPRIEPRDVIEEHDNVG